MYYSRAPGRFDFHAYYYCVIVMGMCGCKGCPCRDSIDLPTIPSPFCLIIRLALAIIIPLDFHMTSGPRQTSAIHCTHAAVCVARHFKAICTRSEQSCLARIGFRGANSAMGLVSLYQGTLSVLVLLSLEVQG